MKNEMQFRIHAENHLRARLLEAENYQMLNQLRNHYPKGIWLEWHEMVDRFGRSLIAMGKKLEGFEVSLATWFEYEGRLG